MMRGWLSSAQEGGLPDVFVCLLMCVDSRLGLTTRLFLKLKLSVSMGGSVKACCKGVVEVDGKLVLYTFTTLHTHTLGNPCSPSSLSSRCRCVAVCHSSHTQHKKTTQGPCHS